MLGGLVSLVDEKPAVPILHCHGGGIGPLFAEFHAKVLAGRPPWRIRGRGAAPLIRVRQVDRSRQYLRQIADRAQGDSHPGRVAPVQREGNRECQLPKIFSRRRQMQQSLDSEADVDDRELSPARCRLAPTVAS